MLVEPTIIYVQIYNLVINQINYLMQTVQNCLPSPVVLSILELKCVNFRSKGSGEL